MTWIMEKFYLTNDEWYRNDGIWNLHGVKSEVKTSLICLTL